MRFIALHFMFTLAHTGLRGANALLAVASALNGRKLGTSAGAVNVEATQL